MKSLEDYIDKVRELDYVNKCLDILIFNEVKSRGYINFKIIENNINKGELDKDKTELGEIVKSISKSDTFDERYDKIRKVDEIELNEYNNHQLKQILCLVIFGLKGTDNENESFTKTEIFKLLLDKRIEDKKEYNCYLKDDYIYRDEVKIEEIKNLQSYISFYEDFNLEKDSIFLFRGHENINYSLIPTLYRNESLKKNELNMYNELLVNCYESFRNCVSKMDHLMQMQHYGLPTRLLDFTTNPLIALYFACQNEKIDGEVVVIKIKKTDLRYDKDNEVEDLARITASENSENCDDKILFVKSIFKNQRIKNQSGLFALCGEFPTNKEIINLFNLYRFKKNDEMIVAKIPNGKNKVEILQQLEQIGIHRGFIYPEIDDYAEFLKEHYINMDKNTG